MKLTSLVLAAATTIAARSVFDFDIKFTAYGGPVCTGKVYHVKDLFHNHCWPFAYAESPRPSLTVYADENCATKGFSLGDAKSTFRQCGNATFSDGGGEYRSVGVTSGGASLAKPPKFVLGTPKGGVHGAGAHSESSAYHEGHDGDREGGDGDGGDTRGGNRDDGDRDGGDRDGGEGHGGNGDDGGREGGEREGEDRDGGLIGRSFRWRRS
ncbi:hypothetical protein LTR53_009205 [Teratosphaeriaceae sp. CCFEE 6253]|nr:hypothetical protein LTR53_009205 [Teratosphaeriaceae sp. CCFEE 6253]